MKQNQENSFWKELSKTNPISVIVVYLMSYLFATLLISIIVSFTIGSQNGLTLKEAFTIQMTKASLLDEKNLSIYYQMQAYTNVFSYLVMVILVSFIGRKYLKDDLKKNKSYKTILLIILCAFIFSLANIGITNLSTLIISKISDEGTSANEAIIENMVKYGNSIPVGISVILLAPLTEELVYRCSVMELSDKLKPIYQILISGLIFSIPHMMSSVGYSFNVFLILELVYLIDGILLASIYYIFNKNVYASLASHTLSNTIAFILMLI